MAPLAPAILDALCVRRYLVGNFAFDPNWILNKKRHLPGLRSVEGSEFLILYYLSLWNIHKITGAYGVTFIFVGNRPSELN